MAALGELKIRDMSFLTLTVNVTRSFYIRQAIGIWLIKLACRVMRCGIEFKNER